MSETDMLHLVTDKARKVFGNLVIDKRRLPASQLQKRGVPAYVGEWVLDDIVPGEGALTPEETERLQDWASRFIPGPRDSKRILHRLRSGEHVKVLTPVEVEIQLNQNKAEVFARLKLVGIPKAHISDEIINENKRLLDEGMWGLVELLYLEGIGVVIASFRPMQASIDIELFKEARREFTLEEWRWLLLLSMGYNPQVFSSDEQTLLLCRLIPLVQKSAHLMELAPKGTGKSYIYENISPHVKLVSGGNVSPAVMFVNNATDRWGILARYAVVVLDEVQTLHFDKPAEIVGGLKGFLANGRLSRGGLHETSSDCSFVMLANITLNERQEPIRQPLVEELPEFLRETAFLDRIRGLLPGWQLRKLTADCFATTLGLKADFFGDALLALRNELEIDEYCYRHLRLRGTKRYQRNEEAVRSLASGLMKIQFPHGEPSPEEFLKFCVEPAVRLRQQVWNQIYLLDAEYRQYEERIECSLV
ncbi:MAG: BREX system Lon protease-like protein BrxL [Acidobacteriota bacterium]